jgi:hypothetical protein
MPRWIASSEQAELMIPVPPMNNTFIGHLFLDYVWQYNLRGNFTPNQGRLAYSRQDQNIKKYYSEQLQ